MFHTHFSCRLRTFAAPVVKAKKKPNFLPTKSGVGTKYSCVPYTFQSACKSEISSAIFIAKLTSS